MRPKHWLFFSSAAICASHLSACSSAFDACSASRSCAPTNDAGAAGAETGAAGSPENSGNDGGSAGESASNPGVGGESEAGAGGEAGATPIACDATLSACGTACVDLKADSKNCGKCGHDCLGSTCTLGTCDALQLEKDQGTLFTISVDDQNVYWGGDNAAIGERSLSGTGNTTVLVKNGAKEYSYSSVLAGQTLYWGNDWHDTGLRSCALPDCSAGPTTSISGSSNVHAMAYDPKSKTLFWDQSDGIWHKVLPNGISELFVPRTSKVIKDVKSDGTFLYWAEFDEATKLSAIYKTPVGNLSITPLALNRPLADRIAIAGDVLYFIEYPTPNGSNDIRSVSLPNGVGTATPPLVAPAGGQSLGIVADTNGVYWTVQGGGADSISSCPVTGCTSVPKILAPATNPWGITADAKAVYWVEASGRVMKVAK